VSATRYLRSLLLATLALLGVAALFNLLVDPYGLFRVISLEGFNRIKSQAGQRAETFKRHGAERMRPNALILGNSRAEVGFDPQSPAWPVAVRPVFNLALPGAGVDSALDDSPMCREVRHRSILVGLDFLVSAPILQCLMIWRPSDTTVWSGSANASTLFTLKALAVRSLR
jgi:hypothetical protein